MHNILQSRTDLKVPSDRRNLAKHFLSHGSPAFLLGVHLCGTLSLRCIDLFNDCPGFGFLALKPCCLPEMLFAQRGDVFGREGGHCFPAKAVCATGKWNKGKWVNGASRDELERKFGLWVNNLSLCVECDPADAAEGERGTSGRGTAEAASCVQVQRHIVQPRWFLNDFIFARRPWSAEPPRSSAYQPAAPATLLDTATKAAPLLPPADTVRPPNTSNSSGLSEAQRKEVLDLWLAGRREEKRLRRLRNRTAEQQAAGDAKAHERRGRLLRIRLEPESGTSLHVQMLLEVHDNAWVPWSSSSRPRPHLCPPNPGAVAIA